MVTEPDVVLEDAVVALEGDAVVLEGCVVALKKGTAVADEHCFSDVQLLYASEVASVPFIHICESVKTRVFKSAEFRKQHLELVLKH